jgi:hypothetical protein
MRMMNKGQIKPQRISRITAVLSFLSYIVDPINLVISR